MQSKNISCGILSQHASLSHCSLGDEKQAQRRRCCVVQGLTHPEATAATRQNRLSQCLTRPFQRFQHAKQKHFLWILVSTCEFVTLQSWWWEAGSASEVLCCSGSNPPRSHSCHKTEWVEPLSDKTLSAISACKAETFLVDSCLNMRVCHTAVLVMRSRLSVGGAVLFRV